MSNFPNFSSHGYQVIRELGHNYIGGRITYLATDTKNQQSVVIKQFHFAKFASNWSGFNAYEREIEVLRGLNHPGIPRYLNSFETPDGFCMVQEYKNAQPLSSPRSFDPDEIKQIAISILEILVYLQNRIPSVIHRDIKPENILVDEQLNVYLVDFGFARIGGGEIAMSSVALGTLGFMPPEQLYNRQLTEATDLYSLGMTLICLLTRTKSTQIDALIDEDGRINFKPLVSKLSLRFIDWLEKLVQHNPKNRYANATAALESLKPLYLIRLPEVQLSQSSLEFKATRLGEKLTQTITVNNSIPETVLEGRWEVAPHDSDPPHTPETHAWIKFAPANFASNQAECKITVDTSQLMANKAYKRQILLHTNSATETYSLTIQVQTAAIPIATKKIPYFSLALLGGICCALSWLALQICYLSNLSTVDLSPVIQTVLMLLIVGYFIFLLVLFFGSFMMFITKDIAVRITKEGYSKLTTIAILILTIGLGSSLGVGLKLGASNLFALAAVLGTGLPLAGMMLYPRLKRRQIIAQYRQSEQHLIKP